MLHDLEAQEAAILSLSRRDMETGLLNRRAISGTIDARCGALGFLGDCNDSKYHALNETARSALPLFRPGSRLVNTLDQNDRFDGNDNREITNKILGFGSICHSHPGDRRQANSLTADPYNLISATVGFRFERYEVAFASKGPGDERGATFLGAIGPLSARGSKPRTIGVRLRILAD